MFFDVVKDVEDLVSEFVDVFDRNVFERSGWRVSSRYFGERFDWFILVIFVVMCDMVKYCL